MIQYVELWAYQVVKNRHNIVLSRAHASVIISLERSHCIVSIHSTSAFLVQTTNHAEGIVRKEAAVVQGHTQ